MVDTVHSALMKRTDMEEVPYIDGEGASNHVQLSDASSSKSKFFPAFIATLVAALGPLNFGFALGFSSPVESGMERDSSSPQLSKEEFSWFASLVGIGAIGGALVGGWAIEYFGRKTALMLYSAPFAAGWLLIANAHHGWMLFLGRILTGMAVGSTSLTVPVYIAEISHPDYRGGLGSINQLAVTLGVVVAYLTGTEFSKWKDTALFAVGPIVLLLLLMLFMPETPRWLLANNQRNKALKELLWLRGPKYDIEEECFEIESNLDMQEKMTLKELWQPALRKPLIIGILMMVFQQMSGVNALLFYAENIFIEAGINNPGLMSNLFSLTQFVATGIACLVVDRFGRRILLLIGGVGMCLCQISIGTYYELNKSLHSNQTNTTMTLDSLGSASHSLHSEHSWLAIGGAYLFIAFFSLGWGPLPWLLMSEVFPPRAKGLAGSICTLINWLFVFLVTKVFPSMIAAFTEEGTFWFFAGWCLLSFIFVYFLVPETKGRSLEDIELYFSEGHFPNQATQS